MGAAPALHISRKKGSYIFWPEISALGVFSNFDNECMRPPKYPSAPPPPHPRVDQFQYYNNQC